MSPRVLHIVLCSDNDFKCLLCLHKLIEQIFVFLSCIVFRFYILVFLYEKSNLCSLGGKIYE